VRPGRVHVVDAYSDKLPVSIDRAKLRHMTKRNASGYKHLLIEYFGITGIGRRRQHTASIKAALVTEKSKFQRAVSFFRHKRAGSGYRRADNAEEPSD